MPPFGHRTQLRVFVDPDLLQYDEVRAAAGTWNDNFGANPNDIVRVAGGVVTDLKRGYSTTLSERIPNNSLSCGTRRIKKWSSKAMNTMLSPKRGNTIPKAIAM